MLGERRGQGLGVEATRLTLDWAFTVLGLHNVLLVAFSWNTAPICAYQKASFREIGWHHGTVVKHGERFDQVLMDAVRSEFTESALAPEPSSDNELR